MSNIGRGHLTIVYPNTGNVQIVYELRWLTTPGLVRSNIGNVHGSLRRPVIRGLVRELLKGLTAPILVDDTCPIVCYVETPILAMSLGRFS